MKWLSIVALPCLILGFGSCGGDGGGERGLERNKAISTLTATERVQLCDQLNGAQGGYGRDVSCPDGTMQHTDANQASCVQATPAPGQPCANLTVANVLDCGRAVGSDLCKVGTAEACKPIRDCSGL
jgi:hypothetical protein